MTAARATLVLPARALRGALRVPPDKSLSHRYALLSALADGVTTIDQYSTGADCLSTLACLEALGTSLQRTPRADGLSVPSPLGHEHGEEAGDGLERRDGVARPTDPWR